MSIIQIFSAKAFFITFQKIPEKVMLGNFALPGKDKADVSYMTTTFALILQYSTMMLVSFLTFSLKMPKPNNKKMYILENLLYLQLDRLWNEMEKLKSCLQTLFICNLSMLTNGFISDDSNLACAVEPILI